VKNLTILLYVNTYSMQQSPSSEANRPSLSQEIFRILPSYTLIFYVCNTKWLLCDCSEERNTDIAVESALFVGKMSLKNKQICET